MKNKKHIRERNIDFKKSIPVIKDLDKEKLEANHQLIEYNNIEEDLKKVIQYYDKIKKKQIPQAKIINEKNVNNYYINNNIIYKNENTSNINSNNEEYKLNYKLKEIKIQNHYIIYSSQERNKVNSTKKEYEAKEADFLFLKFRENFMKIEELENIIIDLENNATYDKDEKVDEVKAKNIIEIKYSKYKNYADAIIYHFKDRRKTIKNSLLRRKWHRDKTFQIRKADKIKTRKNTHNVEESLKKIIEAEENSKNHILPIINSLFLKESFDKNLLKLEEYIFQAECDKIKGMKISGNRIKENNLVTQNIEQIAKKLDDQLSNKKLEMKIEDNNIINNIKENKNQIKGNNINSKISNIKDENIGIDNDKLKNDVKNKSDSNVNGPFQNNEIKNNNERKIHINKNNAKNKNEMIFPLLNLDALKSNKKTNNSLINNTNNKYRVRIRLNRRNNITVDRYIEVKDDFNPFHDSFNQIINKYKTYNYSNYKINTLEHNNFENLLNNYNSNFIQNLPLDDSDDDSTAVNNDMKQFSSSYKQFLKLKRAHL